jgi:UDP-N-acetylmuramate dehydrogenase
LIERAGLKGKQVGHVTMFDQNPNYFIAKSGAKSADVLQLVEMVRAQVKERLAIDLPLAVQIW